MLLNSFRRLFSNSQNRKTRRVSGSPRLELLSLEQRIVPATFTYTGANLLTIDLDNANEAITLTSSGGGNYVFSSSSNFTGTNTSGLTGNGTPTLTITSALTLDAVAITDSTNTGSIVNFDTSTGAYVDAFSITLDNTPGAVSVIQNTTFSGAASLTVNTSGSVSVAAGLGAGTGAISLTGTTGITLGSNITSSGTLFLNSTVTLASAVTLTGSTVTNSSTIAGNSHSLAIIGNAVVNGAMSNIGSYSVSGTTQLGASVTSALPVTANTVTATITVGTNPIGVAVNPAGTLAYVANYFSSGTVSVINTATNAVAATITVGTKPVGVAVNPAGTLAYVANEFSGTVSVINTATNAVTATITVGTKPIGVAVNPAGTLAYVTNQNLSGTVSVINTATNAVTATIFVDKNPYGVAVNPEVTLAYVTNNGSNTVSVINTATNAVTATISVGSGNGPRGVAFNPAGTLAYVTNQNSSTVSVINTATNAVTATITVGTNPIGVAVNPAGTLAYVANFSSNTVSVINTATNAVTATITVGTNPIGVAVNPAGTLAYVANHISNTVSVINLLTGTQTYTGAVTLTADVTLNAGASSINLPGTVSGAFSLTPITSGAGLTTISGATTNTTTVVTTGVVQINNSTASTTNFDVSGGTLKGTGSIGNLTGTGTGIIAPGNSPGQVTTTNLSLSSGNTLQIEINNVSSPVAGTDYDQIVVGGNVTLGGATLSLSTTFTGNSGTVFTIIDNQGGNAVSGTFNGLAEGSFISANGRSYKISYVGGTGNDVTLTVNPTITLNTANLALGATTLTINGTGFDTTAANNTVTFNNGAVGTVSSATSTTLTINLTTLSTAGNLTAVVTTNGASSGTAVQVATVNPTITLNTANIALGATTLTINGTGFDTTPGNNTVSFNNGAVGTVSSATSTALTINLTTLSTAGNLTAVVTTNGASSGTAVQVATVVPAPTTTTLTSSVNPSLFGQSVTFTATVAVTSPGTGTATGSVQFFDGQTSLGTVTLTSGSATSAAITNFGVSTHSITAVYSGSSNFVTSTSTAVSQVVNLGIANTPAFGTTTSNDSGFTVQISNYDGAFTYAGTATPSGAVVVISNTGLVTVTNVAANTSSTATITTTRTNYVSGSAQVTATSLNPTPSPTPTPTPIPTPTPTAPLVVGTPPPTSSSGSSTVTLYDPVTGAEAGTAVPFPGFDGPVKVVSGDFNNDGVADIVAGAGFGGGPAIAILNSQTGEVMESFFAFDPAFTGGVFVAVQDVNNDGILDVIASAGPGGGPEVRIFNGANLNLLRSFYAYSEDFSGGVSVASIDFNNDGILDLVTGAGPGGAPHVKVYDGATNAIISQWYAYPVTFTGGVFVAVGDIGNDNTFEVVTGAGQGGTPVVAVWDPYTGALLAQFMAYAEDFTGGVRVAVNDGNGDGVADILTGAGPSGGPHVKAFSFPALDLLFSFYSGDPANTGGVFVS